MSPSLLLVLGLPLFLWNGPPSAPGPVLNVPGESPAGITGTIAPAAPVRSLSVPGDGSEPRLKNIEQHKRTDQPVLLGEPIRLAAAPFTVHLTELSSDPRPDHVIVYLDDRRVGSKTAEGPTLAVWCDGAVIPKQGCLLRVLIFRDGAGLIPLPPVVVSYVPAGVLESAERRASDEEIKRRTPDEQTQKLPPAKAWEATAPLPPREAFQAHPTVDRVPDTWSVAGSEGGRRQVTDSIYPESTWWWDRPGMAGGTATREPLQFLCHYFEMPAHFSLPLFTKDCPGPKAEGVVIHEGMRFLAGNDGRYEVQFTATAPAMPVTIRLQLLIQRKSPGNEFFTLTLPPIEIQPEKDARGMATWDTWQIRHLGYSRQIEKYFSCLYSVQREGAARFGSPPPP